MLSPRLCRAAFALLALSGCASSGSFPSLAPRPIERQLAGPDVPPPPPAAIPDDPQLPARLAGFVAAARQGQAGFESAVAAARAAVARAGASGSDSWVAAQQAISRVEAARTGTFGARADLDAFVIDQAKARPLSPADSERVRAATAEIEQLADSQTQAIAELQARLKR